MEVLWKVAWVTFLAVSFIGRQQRGEACQEGSGQIVAFRELPQRWLIGVVKYIGFEEPMLPNGRDHH